MRTYINYCGKSNSGKTTVLFKVIEKLKMNYPNDIFREKKAKSKKRIVDERIVFFIHKQYVVISTYGDTLADLLENHRWFDQYGPKVMVTASHAHESHDHNLFIDNYVYNKITADNEPDKYREHFNYCKIQSVPCSDEKEQKRIDDIHADYIYNLILESLKI